MKNFILLILVLCLFTASGFSQINNATLTGTVSDATKAVLPGVAITSTNIATGVSLTNVTNEAGAYTIQSLLPGTYSVTAELPGFQKETYANVQLGNGITVRLNFTLNIASQTQSVEVIINAETILATSSPTIGQALTEKRVSELPVIGNNVLDMLSVLGGLDNLVATSANPSAGNAGGRETTTLAGISAQDTPVLRDGIMVSDIRYPTGINTNTIINPDMVGEIRLIVSPVDAELGRGNGAVQISTRSGTNKLHGAAVWSIQNAILNANSFSNNRTNTPLNWLANNQGTGSVGGPIVKNKTFFYALWDMNFNRQRAYTNSTVLTPCARNGVFRYFDGWNNGGYNATLTRTGTSPTRPVVDLAGNPLIPTDNVDRTPYNGKLNYISVFGPVTFSGGTPNADCSNGIVNGSWDQYRTKKDSTGLIDRTIALMPPPNDFNALNNGGMDGLNTASYRYLNHFKGADNLFSVGEATGDRRQINTRIDHNFNQKHRANVALTYERVSSDDVVAGLPNTWSNGNYHRPTTITSSVVSTLSSSLVNEGRFGYRSSGTNVVSPWDLEQNKESINKYLPQPVNGFQILPDITGGGVGLCSPITGGRPPGTCASGGANGSNLTVMLRDRSAVWTFGDTLSWTKGRHTIKYGGEIRFSSSATEGGSSTFNFTNFRTAAVVVAGATPNAPLLTTGATAINNQNPAMVGIGFNDAAKARNLLNFLSGSLQSINNQYFLNKPTDTQFSDYRTSPFYKNHLNQREFDFFFKDDYKMSKNLTLNLGMRYDWYGVPFSPAGLTVAAVGGGGAAFGISGRDFNGWMSPGARADETVFQFVGKNSNHSSLLPYNNDSNNISPAVGFAYQLPWLGAGKTTIRGGYQITYQGGGRFNTIDGPLTAPPGRIYNGSYTGSITQPYLDLTQVTAANIPTPLPAGVAPMTKIPITDRSQSGNFFDPNYVSPYVQNLVLAVTRSVRPNVTVDVRYVGTLARKLYSSINLNANDFLYNGLAAEFESIRNGTDNTPILNKILNGVNICQTGCTAGQTYGAIGTTVSGVPQTAAYQLRSSTTFNTNLAGGNWNSVAGSLNTLNYTQAANCATLTDSTARATGNCGLPTVNTSTTRGAVLRANGFAENFIATNPQFSTATYYSNMGSANYHSVQAEVTLRPTHGLSGAANYTFSKDLGLPAFFTNPVERHRDYTIVNSNHPHILRANGNIELPIGPGKLLFRNSHGVFARAIEGWRLGGIYTISSGAWTSITAQSMLYFNGVPDIANAGLLKEMLDNAGVKWGVPGNTSNLLEGDFFDRTKWVKVADPQCAGVTSLQTLSGTSATVNGITTFTPRCTLQAIAKIVPDSTAGAIANIDGLGHSGQYVLVNPKPGTQGNLGQNVLRGIAPWRFDANLSKSLRLTESKRLEFRVDTFNVLNHDQPGNPSLSINTASTPFGQITTKNGNAPRFVQGQLRLQF